MYTLSDLAYLKQVAFFRYDMIQDMKELGITHDNAVAIAYTDSIKNAVIVQWWIDYGDSELGPVMEIYLQSVLDKRKAK